MEHETNHVGSGPDGGRTGTIEPGSGVSRVVAVIVATIGFLVAAGWQNLGEDLQYKVVGGSAPVSGVSADRLAPGAYGPTDLMARMFVRAIPWYRDTHPGVVIGNVESGVTGPEDHVRAVIMVGAYEGDGRALERIDEARERIAQQEMDRDPGGGPFDLSDSDALVLGELDALELIHTSGRGALSDDQRDQLVARYGVLGEVAVTHGLEDSHPDREPHVTGFVPIILVILVFGVLVLAGVLGGFAALVIGIVMLVNGSLRMRHVPSAPGGSVMIETFGVFVVLFGLISIGTTVLVAHVDPALGALALPAQALLMVVPCWPILRGMRVRDWRRSFGLYADHGVGREVVSGIVGYLACVPLFLVGTAVTLVILMIQEMMRQSSGAPELPAPSNPIFEVLAGSGVVGALIIFLMATVWAPFTEELLLRGAVFGAMRKNVGIFLAALGSGLIFAYLHSYGPLMVTPLVVLGVMFALMRAWRGSIIAPMVAHFIHNAVLVGFMIAFVTLIGD